MNTLRRLLLLLAFGVATSAASAQDSISSEGVIAAPVADVWAAFSTGAGLRSWMVRGNASTVMRLQEKFGK